MCPRFSPYLGGVETHVEEVCKRLEEKGFEVDILTVDIHRNLPVESFESNIKIRRFKSYSPIAISQVFYPSFALKRFLAKNSCAYDIVHAHNYHALPALYASQAKSSNTLVFTPHYHGGGSYMFRNMLHIPYKFFGRKIFEKAEKTICVSEYEKKLVLTNLGVDLEKIIVIPNGVDFNEFEGIQKKKRAFKSILYVGRLEKYKGIQYLLKVLPELGDDTIIEIVGSGPYKENLIKLATSLGIENKIKFFHNLSRTHLLKKYIESDIFVLLSSKESYGIVVAEALLSGTPCLVSKSSALREWIDGIDCFGINVPPDIDELKNLIQKLIGNSVHRENVRKRVSSWDSVTEKLIRTYENLK